jgi:hypothetical protein
MLTSSTICQYFGNEEHDLAPPVAGTLKGVLKVHHAVAVVKVSSPVRLCFWVGRTMLCKILVLRVILLSC